VTEAASSLPPEHRAVELSIVIPGYNEEESLPLLWPEIREVLEPSGLRYEVVFVDDGRDRSAEIVRGFDPPPASSATWFWRSASMKRRLH